MKRFKINTFIVFIIIGLLLTSLLNCSTKYPPSEKPNEDVVVGSLNHYGIKASDCYISGMHYKVFNSASGSMFVVNITKDSLEVLNLKQK